MRSMEKNALSPEQRNEYIKAAVLAAVAAAGTGAVIKSVNSKKRRSKALDVESSKNAIIVPVRKSKFMEGLPTPDEFDASMGVSNMTASTDTAQPGAMSNEDIAAKKKAIQKDMARKFNFFGSKAAEYDKPSEDDDSKVDNSKSKDDNESSEGKKPEHVVLRDQSGRFASHAYPVAVEQEKNAYFPGIDFAKRVFRYGTDKPVWVAGGAIGSIYLTSLIADKINEHRRANAKDRLENERDRYIKLLEGESVKSAEDTISKALGRAGGYAFFLPFAMTALITKQILDNRKEEKKRAKERSDSFPDDPIVLYKTSSAKEIEIEPKTALMLFAIKQAMIIDAEKVAAEASIEKSAQSIALGDVKGYMPDVPDGAKSYTDQEIGDAIDYARNIAMKSRNQDALLNLVKAYGSNPNDTDAITKAYQGFTIPGTDKAKAFFGFGPVPKNFQAIASTPEFRARMAQDSELQDYLADQFNNNSKFRAYRDEQIDNGIANWLGDDKREGWLFKVFSWLAKNTGIGNWLFKRNLRNTMSQVGQAPQNSPGVSNNGSGANQGAGDATGASQNGGNGVVATTAPANPPTMNEVMPDFGSRYIHDMNNQPAPTPPGPFKANAPTVVTPQPPYDASARQGNNWSDYAKA